jgi:hypothetical protein
MAVTPSITFSRSALEVFGLKIDRTITGSEIAQLATVLRRFCEVNVRFSTRRPLFWSTVFLTPGAVALDRLRTPTALTTVFVIAFIP